MAASNLGTIAANTPVYTASEVDTLLAALSGGTRGQATIDFGAFPGQSETSVAITGQTGLLAGSVIQASVQAIASADHTADEHNAEEFAVEIASVVAGTGFTIVARPRVGTAYGIFNFAWSWI